MSLKQFIISVAIISCGSLAAMATVMLVIYHQLQAEFHQLQHTNVYFEHQLNESNGQAVYLKIQLTNLTDQLNKNNQQVAKQKTELTKLNGQLDTTKGEMERFGGFRTSQLNTTTQEKMANMKIKLTILTDQLKESIGDASNLKTELTLLYGQLNTSQANMEQQMGFVTRQMNNTIHEQGANFKIQLTDLTEKLVKVQESLKKSALVGSSCKNLLDMGYNRNGVYTIKGTSTSFKTFCDMDAGGYIVFQKRFDGSTDFNQTFESYVDGFGNVDGEYWLGLEKLYQMTKTGRHQLRVDLLAYDNDTAYALYDNFTIGRAPDYKLHYGNFNGTAGNSLIGQNGQNFSTPDHDADIHPSPWGNCAKMYQGAGWFRKCAQYANLNAFQPNSTTEGNALIWTKFKGYNTPLKATTMMFREV